MVDFDKVKEIQEQYAQNFGDTYFSCGISKIGVARRDVDDFRLNKGENLDDFCLRVVTNRDPVSEGLPTEYQGVRVFYVAGEQPQPL